MFWRRGKDRAAANAVRQKALDEIARTWSVDGSDVTLRENGFDWLPGSHLVKVRIQEGERERNAALRFRVTISTDYLRSVSVNDREFVRQAGLAAQLFFPTYSPVYPPGELVAKHYDGKPVEMELFSSAYVYDETVDWTSGFLARMSIMQPIGAERLSRSPVAVKSGSPALATGAIRPTVHGVLNIDSDLLIPEGAKPGRWIGSAEFEAFIQQYGRNDACFGNASENGMTLETPFGADSALVQFNADERDYQLGNGLTIVTRIRTSTDLDAVCDEAAWLNYFESVQWTDFPQFGRWHPLTASDGATHLAHTSFVPNAYFNKGIVVNSAFWALARVRWTRERLLPDEQDLTMIEILENRFGRSFR